MANYRQIHTQIWTDNWFLDLEPDEKLLFIYLFSNDKTSLSGLYEIHYKLISFETGMPMTRINEILQKFADDGKVYSEDGVIWIVNMTKYHAYKNESVKTRIETDIKAVPDCELKRLFLKHNGKAMPTPCKTEKDTLPTPCGQTVLKEKEKEKEKETNTTTTPAEFLQFAEVFQQVTGSEPKVLNAEIEAVAEIIRAGGSVEDYRLALQGMQDKQYTIGNMASALTWTLKDIEKRKQPRRSNNGGHKPKRSELDEILDGAPIFAEDK